MKFVGQMCSLIVWGVAGWCRYMGARYRLVTDVASVPSPPDVREYVTR